MEEQAAVLRHLLVHLETKEAAGDSEDGLGEEFSRLKTQSIQYRTDNTFPSRAALIKDNVKKNRYKDIVPFDHTRVTLSLNVSQHDVDYINASFIKGVTGSRAYIATQGPLPHTLLDFFRMIWEYKIQVVVMACREFEMGRKKCERYWPEKQTQPFVCPPFTVYCDYDEKKGDYWTRELRIVYQNSSRVLRQLHYVNWPDHGVPDSIPPILDLLQEMRLYQDHDDAPICIHCSAGCGRTGVLCVIDYTWNLLKRQTIPADFSIYELVQDMRTQRPSVVQTKEQYELVYKTIKFLFENYLQSCETPATQTQVQPAASPLPAAAAASTLPAAAASTLPATASTLPATASPLPATASTLPATATQTSEPRELSEGDLQPPSQRWLDPEARSLRLETQVLDDTQLGPSWSAQETVLARPQTDDRHWIIGGEEEEEEEEEPQQLHDPHHHHHHHHHPPPDLPQRPLAEAGTQAAPQGPDQGLLARPEDESADPEDGTPPPKPSRPRLATACLTVEDPYFEGSRRASLVDEPLESLMEDLVGFRTPTVTLNDRGLPPDGPCSGETENVFPPALPTRTAESFMLVDSEHAESSGRLEVVIPQNAAALAVREMGGASGPPSPVPPLPERTPESYQLAPDGGPVEPRATSQPVGLNRVGVSSEWFCSSLRATVTQHELNPWSRSKSLKVPKTSTEFLTPPLPHRTPESFVLAAEQADESSVPHLQASDPGPWMGASSEWPYSSQPKGFVDFVLSMKRSKSVRAKSSRQEPIAVVRQLAPPSVVFSGAGSGAEQHVASVSAQTSEDRTCHPSNGKVMPRTRSLKFFRSKGKSKPESPAVPAQPGQQALPAAGTSGSGFRFGFGNRFTKPKGPRSYPEPWM